MTFELRLVSPESDLLETFELTFSDKQVAALTAAAGGTPSETARMAVGVEMVGINEEIAREIGAYLASRARNIAAINAADPKARK